jgi:predicted GIY-YIG superfamily endonuclease
MAFYVYMLLCSDESMYAGHTADLEAQIADHKSRRYSGYTAKLSPSN